MEVINVSVAVYNTEEESFNMRVSHIISPALNREILSKHLSHERSLILDMVNPVG